MRIKSEPIQRVNYTIIWENFSFNEWFNTGKVSDKRHTLFILTVYLFFLVENIQYIMVAYVKRPVWSSACETRNVAKWSLNLINVAEIEVEYDRQHKKQWKSEKEEEMSEWTSIGEGQVSSGRYVAGKHTWMGGGRNGNSLGKYWRKTERTEEETKWFAVCSSLEDAKF